MFWVVRKRTEEQMCLPNELALRMQARNPLLLGRVRDETQLKARIRLQNIRASTIEAAK